MTLVILCALQHGPDVEERGLETIFIPKATFPVARAPFLTKVVLVSIANTALSATVRDLSCGLHYFLFRDHSVDSSKQNKQSAVCPPSVFTRNLFCLISADILCQRHNVRHNR